MRVFANSTQAALTYSGHIRCRFRRMWSAKREWKFHGRDQRPASSIYWTAAWTSHKAKRPIEGSYAIVATARHRCSERREKRRIRCGKAWNVNRDDRVAPRATLEWIANYAIGEKFIAHINCIASHDSTHAPNSLIVLHKSQLEVLRERSNDVDSNHIFKDSHAITTWPHGW